MALEAVWSIPTRHGRGRIFEQSLAVHHAVKITIEAQGRTLNRLLARLNMVEKPLGLEPVAPQALPPIAPFSGKAMAAGRFHHPGEGGVLRSPHDQQLTGSLWVGPGYHEQCVGCSMGGPPGDGPATRPATTGAMAVGGQTQVLVQPTPRDRERLAHMMPSAPQWSGHILLRPSLPRKSQAPATHPSPPGRLSPPAVPVSRPIRD